MCFDQNTYTFSYFNLLQVSVPVKKCSVDSNLVQSLDVWMALGDVRPMHHSQMSSGRQEIAKCLTTTVWFHQLEDTFEQQYGWFYGTAHNIPGLCTLPFSLNNCSLSIKHSICWVATPTLPDCSSFAWSPLYAELSYSAIFIFPRNAVDHTVRARQTSRNSPLIIY